MVKRKRGGILFVASMIGHMPNSYYANYAASKAYILNLGTSNGD
jgi:short-subunit dehydrogenase